MVTAILALPGCDDASTDNETDGEKAESTGSSGGDTTSMGGSANGSAASSISGSGGQSTSTGSRSGAGENSGSSSSGRSSGSDETTGTGEDTNGLLDEQPIMGLWTGTAAVAAGTVLLGGDFPIRIAVAQSNNHLVGFLDLQQEQGQLASAYGYAFVGEINGDEVSLTLTDRQCGSVTNCYPSGGTESVFSVEGTVVDGSMTWDTVEVLPGLSYSPESPFESLTVEWQDDYDSKPVDFENTWGGEGLLPAAVVVPVPLPMDGPTTVGIAGPPPGYALGAFINQGFEFVPPYTDDVVVTSSFRADDETGRVWFTQQNRWLYLGQKHGNRITMVIIYDFLGENYQDGEPPRPLSDIAIENVLGVMSLRLE
ncbi:MAG: hypothetical protein KUG77_01030 [Nannocystaceae bacterium]|nr:hypothetical protein [Nannocystaceae bacterium]